MEPQFRRLTVPLRRGRRWILGVLAAVAIVTWASTATATVMVYCDLPKLVEISDVIVHGEVVDQKSYFHETQQRIVTDTTIRVHRAFLGEPGTTVTLQQWGGQVGDEIAKIPGDAEFELGEEVVVFLHRGPKSQPGLYLSALAQSKYRVLRGDDEIEVVRDMRDVAVATDKTAKRIRPGTIERNGFVSFSAELEALVAGIKGGRR